MITASRSRGKAKVAAGVFFGQPSRARAVTLHARVRYGSRLVRVFVDELLRLSGLSDHLRGEGALRYGASAGLLDSGIADIVAAADRAVADQRCHLTARVMPLITVAPTERLRLHSRRWAMLNGRCRMHGGASTGPRTPEGLQRIVAARTVHGGYSAESRRVAAMIRDLKAEAKRLMELT